MDGAIQRYMGFNSPVSSLATAHGSKARTTFGHVRGIIRGSKAELHRPLFVPPVALSFYRLSPGLGYLKPRRCVVYCIS